MKNREINRNVLNIYDFVQRCKLQSHNQHKAQFDSKSLLSLEYKNKSKLKPT